MNVTETGAYPEDWREQGWCCRECAVMAWNAMSPEMRGLFVTETDDDRGDHQ